MRRRSHGQLFFRIYKQIIIIFVMILCLVTNKSYALIDKENTQKIFSLGRGVGASYYHLTDLCDKARFKPYSALKNEYNQTFQSLNVMDVILDDLETNSVSHKQLNRLRINFYNSLKAQDLNEISLLNIRDSYILYYENLVKDIRCKFSSEGSWLFTLGFYSSFQMESLNSPSKSKLLLSGFSKIIASNPFPALPESVVAQLKAINKLDKTYMNVKEIEDLKQNIIKVTEYFGSYPENKPLSNEIKELIGTWQGILIDSDNQRHKIKLVVCDAMNIRMDIDGIAQNIVISDAKLINNYFTFMFKPFGNEKLYIKFNAKISNNMFSGEVVDVLGQKGNWLLSKTEKNGTLSEQTVNEMNCYYKKVQENNPNS